LQKLQKARPETLRKFFIQRHSCKLDNIDRRLEEIHRAMGDRNIDNKKVECDEKCGRQDNGQRTPTPRVDTARGNRGRD
jgi:hypothetical protein